MDLRALSESTTAMGNFLEEVLAFVRDHLVSRPLVMAVAAAAERGANGKGESEDKIIQQGFLLLCEVRTRAANLRGRVMHCQPLTGCQLVSGVVKTVWFFLFVTSI